MKKLFFFLLIAGCSLKSFSQLKDTIIVDQSQLDSVLVNGKWYYSLKLGMTPAQVSQLATASADIKNLLAAKDPQPVPVTGAYTLTAANNKADVYTSYPTASYAITLPAMWYGYTCYVWRLGIYSPTFKAGTGLSSISGGTSIYSKYGFVKIFYTSATTALISIR